jgi:hypothetical protein
VVRDRAWKITKCVNNLLFVTKTGNVDNAVSAYSVTSDRNQNVVGGASVMYDTKLVDINNGFNLDTGVYKAPSSGIYIFHFFR